MAVKKKPEQSKTKPSLLLRIKVTCSSKTTTFIKKYAQITNSDTGNGIQQLDNYEK